MLLLHNFFGSEWSSGNKCSPLEILIGTFREWELGWIGLHVLTFPNLL